MTAALALVLFLLTLGGGIALLCLRRRRKSGLMLAGGIVLLVLALLLAGSLAAYLARFGKPTTACDKVADGVKLAVEHAGKDGVVLCYGSLYMIGEIEACLAQL